MDAEELEQAIQQINSSETWMLLDQIGGVSPSIQAFARDVRESNAKDQEALHVVLIDRPSGSRDVDSAVIEAMDLQDTLRVELCFGAPRYNSEQLFGSCMKPGCFEWGKETLVLSDLDYLDGTSMRRLAQKFAGLPHTTMRRLLILTEVSASVEALFGQLEGVTPIKRIRKPRLRERKQDLVYEIHMAATRHGAGLDTFALDAIDRMCSCNWDGDVAELEYCVRHSIFANNDATSLDQNCVNPHIIRAQEKYSIREVPACEDLWSNLISKRDEVNRLTTALMATPFFVIDTAVIAKSPIGSASPEFDFFRLVSWAYVTLFEQAKPNLDSVLPLMGLGGGSKETVAQVKDEIGRLRTYHQHSLQYSSDHDQSTMEVATKWFEDAIGKRSAGDKDFEQCTRVLLTRLHVVFDHLLKFLNRLNDDEYRNLTLKQWKHRRETTWPKHHFQAIVDTALQNLSRTDLENQKICEALINQMQERLKATKATEDREHILTSLSERLIQERYPEEPPVSGTDLIALGVQAGPKLGDLLNQIRTRFSSHRETRDELLEHFSDDIENAKPKGS